MKLISHFSVLGGLLLLSSTGWAGSTWFVDPNSAGPGDGSFANPYSSLQFALAQPTTVSGDTLEIFAGTFNENVVHPQGKDGIVFRAAGNGEVVINGMGQGSCYRSVESGVNQITFEGDFRFRNGTGTPGSQGLAGGGIRVNRADLILDGSLGGILVTDCSADVGGGIHISRGNLVAEGLQVVGNQALTGLASGGGIYIRQTSLPISMSLTDSFVSGNEAMFGGGLYMEGADLNLDTTVVIDNTAVSIGGPGLAAGGGIYQQGGTANLQNQGNVTSNDAMGNGGGVYLVGASLLMSSTAGVALNKAGERPLCIVEQPSGGGVYGDAQSQIIGELGSRIQGNEACIEGGGIFGVGFVSGVEIFNNVASFGGGVFGAGHMELDDCRLEGNAADQGDGSVAQGGGAHSALLTDCVLDSNTAQGPGGGAYGCDLLECRVIANEAIQIVFSLDDALGGGIHGGSAEECVIESNRAWLGGGAAFCDLTGGRVSGNRALATSQSPGPFSEGGGIFGGSAFSCEIIGNEVRSLIDGVELSGGGASIAQLEGCLVQGNSVTDAGASSNGGIVCRGGGMANCEALRCDLRSNTVDAQDTSGGGAWDGSLESCLIVGNQSEVGGGGASSCLLTQCTVVDNIATIYGGAELVNGISCIFVGNTVPAINGSNSVVLYSLIEGGFTGTGNIDQDPLFVDAAGGDYGLAPGSPCIDSGDPSAFDPDGSRADMGAFPAGLLGNILGSTFCFSNPNSTGGDSVLTVFGSDQVADNDILLRATSLPLNTFGFFLMSALPDFVPNFAGSQGNLCLGAPQLRFNDTILNSGTNGQVAYQVDLTNLPGGTIVMPSETWYFQYWHRDSNPGLTSNTSSASAVLFQ